MSDAVRKPIAYRNQCKQVWCTGCGDYGVLKSFTRAFAKLHLANEKIAIVSGIGCSSRLPGYTATYGFNTVHGRPLPIATGLKVARPELTVVACGGDGDGFAIGIGHIPHAIRRNPDLTYFVMDNSIYGLTKGQASPTTRRETKEAKGLVGVDETPINPVLFVLASGAGFVARTQAGDMAHMAEMLQEAIQYPGFAFIHCLSVCVTYQGRSFQDQLDRDVHPLPTDHNPTDAQAAFQIARTDPWALGIIYRRPLGEEFDAKSEPVAE
ncbi:MAG: 2-oxoacid:ferredoxin oxidoreductase subunit beta [Deltaproteobacteria bacterium]|nr:2-oxoacid:ferredoxin oxidoreductase subunit beta [Deltaproteobacteria bacterium]